MHKSSNLNLTQHHHAIVPLMLYYAVVLWTNIQTSFHTRKTMKMWKWWKYTWKRQRATLNHWMAYSFHFWHMIWPDPTLARFHPLLTDPDSSTSCCGVGFTILLITHFTIPHRGDTYHEARFPAIWQLLLLFHFFFFWWRLGKVSCLIFSKQDKVELPSTLKEKKNKSTK